MLPTEEPAFRKLTDEEIGKLDKEQLQWQLKIDRRDKMNYRGKWGLYTFFGLFFAALSIFSVLYPSASAIPEVYAIPILILSSVALWAGFRAYRKLIREIRPQVLKLEKRVSDLQLE